MILYFVQRARPGRSLASSLPDHRPTETVRFGARFGCRFRPVNNRLVPTIICYQELCRHAAPWEPADLSEREDYVGSGRRPLQDRRAASGARKLVMGNSPPNNASLARPVAA